jgi:uncharacterized glyoxalase superfamily protein PhnB
VTKRLAAGTEHGLGPRQTGRVLGFRRSFKTNPPRSDNVDAMTERSSTPPPTVWHSLSYRDADAAIEFLTNAFGFVAKAVYRDEADPSIVVHAQLDWPPGGGIMFGSERPGGTAADSKAGQAQCYCVTETDADVDRIHEQALALGAKSLRDPVDQDYDGRGCTVADPEGNRWSFGSYRGE